MENTHSFTFLTILIFFVLPFSFAQLLPSETMALFRFQRILEYPSVLNGWNRWTNFCYIPPSQSLKIVCSGNHVIELTVIGNKGSPYPSKVFSISSQTLSSNFSIDSLFTTLSKLSSLKVLSLVSLGLWGPLPAKINRFSSLQVLNISSNFIYGKIPLQIYSLTSIQSFIFHDNLFNGSVPDLSSLTVLEELDLGCNILGPEFPSLGNKLVSLVLRNNSFHSSINSELQSFDQLQRLDISFNQLVGPIPSLLFSLPSIQYLDLAGNKLSGALPMDTSCRNGLNFVDLSHNLLIGGLPPCVCSNSSDRIVLYSWNCLSSGDSKYQHSNSFCHVEVLAAVMPSKQKETSKTKLGLLLGIVGGIVGSLVACMMLIWVIVKSLGKKNEGNSRSQKSVIEKTSVRISPRLGTESRHMSQAMRLGALGLPPYHAFTLEELEEATNNFEPSNLMGEGSQGQLYKGWLSDGSLVVVRCLKLKQRHALKILKQQMEVISKLRHRHLVSILGHCFVTYEESPNATDTIFLVFEYVSNGTLRSHLTERRKQEMLKWPQRLAAATGIARGIQFLHTRIVPGVLRNNFNIKNILLDENLTAKISDYKLPRPFINKITMVGSESPFNGAELDDLDNTGHGDKEDVYQLGVILLEIITGNPITSQTELDVLKLKLERGLAEGPKKLRGETDPSIRGTFAYESLKTAVEITINCLSEDIGERPSIEDVLWNLQYSAQVQDGWTNSENLSTHS
ncbi:putative LRR receptor-like serine/threonine-protein kinase At1g14390 isoform X1 [Tasmannia lanceolata]|uniref:putative LRR receptor-like serine/threonine-protein kinase At1g14390 isoform X1 n=1 Tax=Tasmannia lanceolata TaxID=3420 RepID=UPI004062CBBE